MNDDRGERARPGRRAAVDSALSECCTALERHFAGLEDDAPRQRALEGVRSSLVHFAEVTAEHEIPPERVIVMLKRSVRDLSAIRNWLATDRESLSHQLVQMVIASYYSFGGGKERPRS